MSRRGKDSCSLSISKVVKNSKSLQCILAVSCSFVRELGWIRLIICIRVKGVELISDGPLMVE